MSEPYQSCTYCANRPEYDYRVKLVEEDGALWCRQHRPSVLLKAAERRERAADCVAACAGVDDPQPGELARLRAELARLRGE